MSTSVSDFISTLRASRLLDAAKMDEVQRIPEAQDVDAPTLAQCLVQLGWLTPYQVEQLLLGSPQTLILGSYRILDRLSEGAIGIAGLRAQHVAQTGRFVLRVIPPDRLHDPVVAERFQLAVQTAAQLEHPRVARTLGLEALGDSQVYGREYVEGIDLAQLVQSTGALPAARACDYLAQAAQALHYAHEQHTTHGLVKASNLIVAQSSVLLPAAQNGEPPSTELPPPGAVVKLVDFGLAALVEASPADAVNKDLRDLGSTFAFLLGGPSFQVPADLDPAVQGILLKLLTDQPGEGYRSAADLLNDLKPYVTLDDPSPLVADPVVLPVDDILDPVVDEPPMPRPEHESISTQLERTPPLSEHPTPPVESPSVRIEVAPEITAVAPAAEPPIAAPVEAEVPTGFVPVAPARPSAHVPEQTEIMEEPAVEPTLPARLPAKKKRKYGTGFWIGAAFGLLLHLAFCGGIVYLVIQWSSDPPRPTKTIGPGKTTIRSTASNKPKGA